MANSEKSSDGVRAVDRALDILMAFTPADYELSVSDLIKRVDLSRPTLYRLLYTLEQKGFVTSSGDPQKFRLGPSVAHLSHVWTSHLDISALAQPYLRRVWEESGETVGLFIPQGMYRMCVAELPSQNPLSFRRGVGYREKMVLGASGRVILAYTDLAPEQLHEYLEGTPFDAQDYARELQATRKRGYAISKDELIKGAVAVAVPIFDTGDRVVGSLAVFGPSVRMDGKRLADTADLLHVESGKLSQALGRK